MQQSQKPKTYFLGWLGLIEWLITDISVFKKFQSSMHLKAVERKMKVPSKKAYNIHGSKS